MRIAIFDYFVTPNSPSGSCILRFLPELSQEHDITVFAAGFTNPEPARIGWVRVPVIRRPLCLLFVVYHLVAAAAYCLYRIRAGRRFDSILIVGSNFSFGDTCYAHFCHRAYLAGGFRLAGDRGLRKWARWLMCKLGSQLEPWVFGRARRIVVPSKGLAADIQRLYPKTAGKLRIIANPVRAGMEPDPTNFDREGFRKSLGLESSDVVVVFVALGNFAHKGLDLLLEAMAKMEGMAVKLLVVGGTHDAIASYRRRADNLGIAAGVVFAGMQERVQPYFWAGDAFALPSCYEVFPLVVLEAAGAGLPVIATRLHGVEELLRDGQNGFLIDRSVEGVASGLRRLLALPAERRRSMGEQARRDASRYGGDGFVHEWRLLYRRAGGCAD